MGWLGLPAVPRRQRRQGDPHPHAGEVGRSARDVPGIHINFFFVIFIAAAFTGDVGRDPRRADAAPARRLPGDRDARLRRDRAARLRELDERHLRHRHAPTSPTGARGSRRSTRSTSPGPTTTFKYPLELKPIYYVGLAMVLLVIFFNAACATRAWGARGSPCARTRSRPRRWASTSCARSCGPTRSAPRSAASPASFLATYNNTVNVDQFEFGFSVLHPVHGHHRRHGQHLGRHPRRDRPVDVQPLRAQAAQRRARTSSAWTSTSRRSTSASSASSCW